MAASASSDLDRACCLKSNRTSKLVDTLLENIGRRGADLVAWVAGVDLGDSCEVRELGDAREVLSSNTAGDKHGKQDGMHRGLYHVVMAKTGAEEDAVRAARLSVKQRLLLSRRSRRATGGGES